MHTISISKTMTRLMSLATLAAATVLLPTAQAQAVPQAKKAMVFELPRVVITGQRVDRRIRAAQIVELPRVVITARRGDAPRLVQTRSAARPA